MAPGDHPLRLYRPQLQAAVILTYAQVVHCRDGDMVQVGGQVVFRQKPPTAKNHVFLTLEDETGLVNLIFRPDLYKRRKAELSAALLVVQGQLQREGGAITLVAQELNSTNVWSAFSS